MNDHPLVEGLRARDPDAPIAVYAAYAERLYAYCWFQLRGRNAAQVALRDTFVVAEAHIDKLRHPDRFGPWLYAIARLECARRTPGRNQRPDLPVASHDQEDVDQRLMAWRAVLTLPPIARELLELRVRHQLSVPDLAAVFDLPLKEAQTRLDRAHAELETVLTAQVLAHQGPYGCERRAVLLGERRGDLTPRLSARLMAHAQECAVCGAFRPRAVSAAKVYGLLPQVVPPEGLRLRVMSCFLDPELVSYRLFVATRVTEFTSDGFPLQPRRPAAQSRAATPGRTGLLRRPRRQPGRRARRPGARTAVMAVLALILCGGGLTAVRVLLGSDNEDSGSTALGNGPKPSSPADIPQHHERDARSQGSRWVGVGQNLDAVPVSATFPLGTRASAAPPTALPSPPLPAEGRSDAERRVPSEPVPPQGTGMLEASPLYLDLANEADGAIELRAVGGPVPWHAFASGGVQVSQASGRLEAGTTTSVHVHVSRDARSQGEGSVVFTPGGVEVHVTWRPCDPGTGPGPEPGPGPNPTHPPTTQTPTPGSPHGTPGSDHPTSPSTPSNPAPPSPPTAPPPSTPSSPPPSPDPPPSTGTPPPSGGQSDPPSGDPPAATPEAARTSRGGRPAQGTDA
ncbi:MULTISPECIES: RNA polymerase sigma factor [Actinomadura]|uniref:RNA polymerase sigma factor n=1 Tax=Actinomadura yumaensis TaxID=111807 RepID=A0ABW2CGT6_9ACTN|nr:sigma-70 family RNA polymerase sigma factor [Actinomadura sp. J1-007]MWK35706.1 hypothetical protein [Actinomadura sp. J1-007]